MNDQEAFDWSRRLARREGILVGGSSGMVAAGMNKYLDKLDDDAIVVMLFPDTGERYLGRVFNDAWLRSNGFLPPPQTVDDIIVSKSSHLLPLITVEADDTLAYAIDKIKKFGINQLIVMGGDPRVLYKKELFDEVLSGTSIDEKVATIKSDKLTIIDHDISLAELIMFIISDGPVLIKKDGELITLLTSQDLINNIQLENIKKHVSTDQND